MRSPLGGLVVALLTTALLATVAPPTVGASTLDGVPVDSETAWAGDNTCSFDPVDKSELECFSSIEKLETETERALRANKVPPGYLAMPPKEIRDGILARRARDRMTGAPAPGSAERTALATTSCGLDHHHAWTGGHFNDNHWHGGYTGASSYYNFAGTPLNDDITSYKAPQSFHSIYSDTVSWAGEYYYGAYDYCEVANSLATGNPAWNNRFGALQVKN